jgi:hypothetical protein
MATVVESVSTKTVTVAELDGSGHVPESQLPNSVVSGSGTTVNVAKAPYNIVPGVTANPETIIQEALEAVSKAGGGEVYVPKGTYKCGLHKIPESEQAAMFWMYSNTRLCCDPDTVFLLAAGEKMPSGCTQAFGIGEIIPFATEASQVKENVVIENAILDGNAQNQSEVVIKQGIFHGACKKAWNVRCTVRNIYGTSSSGAGETKAFEHNSCYGGGNIMCEADGSGSAETASGFSCDNSFDIFNAECIAHGYGHSQGFTCWQTSNYTCVSCKSHSNGQAGFNVERSEFVSYIGCIAGGSSPRMGEINPFFPSGLATLGNTFGFQIQGCAHVVVDAGCQTAYNTNYGVALKSDSSGDGVNVKTKGTLNKTTLVTGLEAAQVKKLQIGMGVEGSSIPEKTVIAAIVSETEIELTNAATASTSEELTFDHSRVCYDVRVYGTHRLNATENVYFDDVSYGSQQDCRSVLSDSYEGVTNATQTSARSPYDRYIDRQGEAGLRVGITASSSNGTTPNASLWRIHNETNSAYPLKVNGANQTVTLGRAYALARVENESIELTPSNHLAQFTKIEAAHNVVLPLSSHCEKGTKFEIRDGSGSASGTNKITIKLNSGDAKAKLKGTTEITEAYGHIVVIYQGENASKEPEWVGYPA